MFVIFNGYLLISYIYLMEDINPSESFHVKISFLAQLFLRIRFSTYFSNIKKCKNTLRPTDFSLFVWNMQEVFRAEDEFESTIQETCPQMCLVEV
jgi:hypothetical protein